MPTKWEELMKKEKTVLLFSLSTQCSNNIFFHFVDFLKMTHTKNKKFIGLPLHTDVLEIIDLLEANQRC